MFTTTITTGRLSKDGKPTIYDSLKARLGREPSHSELAAEVRRILNS